MSILNSLKFSKKVKDVKRSIDETSDGVKQNNPYLMNSMERYKWMWKEMIGVNVKSNPTIHDMPIDQLLRNATGQSETFEDLILPNNDKLNPTKRLELLKERFRLAFAYVSAVSRHLPNGQVEVNLAILPIDMYVGFNVDEFCEVGKDLLYGVKQTKDTNLIVGNRPDFKEYFSKEFDTDNPPYQQFWFLKEIQQNKIHFVERSIKRQVKNDGFSKLWKKTKLVDDIVCDVKTDINFTFSNLKDWKTGYTSRSAKVNYEIFSKYGKNHYSVMQALYNSTLISFPQLTSFVVVGGFEYNVLDWKHMVMQPYLDCVTPIFTSDISPKNDN